MPDSRAFKITDRHVIFGAYWARGDGLEGLWYITEENSVVREYKLFDLSIIRPINGGITAGLQLILLKLRLSIAWNQIQTTKGSISHVTKNIRRGPTSQRRHRGRRR
jgi:hypothetical protein